MDPRLLPANRAGSGRRHILGRVPTPWLVRGSVSAASVAGTKLLVDEGVIGPDERVVCILTGHQLKDPNATVAYHTTDQKLFNDVLGKRGVRRAAYANRAVLLPNDLDEIIKAIELYS